MVGSRLMWNRRRFRLDRVVEIFGKDDRESAVGAFDHLQRVTAFEGRVFIDFCNRDLKFHALILLWDVVFNRGLPCLFSNRQGLRLRRASLHSRPCAGTNALGSVN